MKHRMASLWRAGRGMMMIKNSWGKLISFRFKHPHNLWWVMDRGPWTFVIISLSCMRWRRWGFVRGSFALCIVLGASLWFTIRFFLLSYGKSFSKLYWNFYPLWCEECLVSGMALHANQGTNWHLTTIIERQEGSKTKRIVDYL